MFFLDQQHFVNSKQHLLAFVLAVQFIAIRTNKTYITCEIDRPGNLGEPPISDRTCGNVHVEIEGYNKNCCCGIILIS